MVSYRKCCVCKKKLVNGHFTLWDNYPKHAKRFHLECADNVG